MASPILKRTSFALVRTNPKLSTNVKLVADSTGGLFLDSIDASRSLSKSVLKGVRVNPNGSYSFDLSKFWQGGAVGRDQAYVLGEKDASTEVKGRYKSQFDPTYACGAYVKNSTLYPEEFAVFAPIWLEPQSMPDRFVIFKIDGPETVNALDYPDIDPDTDPTLSTMASDPSRFFENVVRGARIIRTFDLSENSNLGKYLRKHATDQSFPLSPLYFSPAKGTHTEWRGVDFDKGGFSSKSEDVYLDYVLADKTITEADDHVTMGFQRNGIVCANLINLEFLFDDPDEAPYKFGRYFGLYCSEAELGQFRIDADRLFADRDRESTQVPRPRGPFVGSPDSTASQVQSNSKGVKVYPALGSTGGIHSGRLVQWVETQGPRFPYVRSTAGTLHSIGCEHDWTSRYTVAPTAPGEPLIEVTDANYLRIKDTRVDWSAFGGYAPSYTSVPALATSERGRPGFSLRVLASPESGDQIRVRVVTPVEPDVDGYTVTGDFALPEGTSNGLLWSTRGTRASVAAAIASAINFIPTIIGDHQIFEAVAQGDLLVVCARAQTEGWNDLRWSVFSTSDQFPFDLRRPDSPVGYTASYVPSPVSLSPPVAGHYYAGRFTGGRDRSGARAIIAAENAAELFTQTEPVFARTIGGGFSPLRCTSMYLDKPVFRPDGTISSFEDLEKYSVVELDFDADFDLGPSRRISMHKYAKCSCGLLSLYPIREFDFDFRSVEYARDADSSPSSLHSWWTGTGASSGSPAFDYQTLGTAGVALVDSVLGPTSQFVLNGGFQSLLGQVDALVDQAQPVTNEYDRLRENSLPDLALSSRVVPFIHKWVYDDLAVNVREVGHRLDADQSFGYSSFSPVFDQFDRDPRFFTHEWFYLQKYPPYMSFEERAASFSYFEDELRFSVPNPGSSDWAGLTGGTGASASLFSVAEDYFTSYFTRESVGGTAVPRDFRYSEFSGGSSKKHPETLFRGAKVEVRERAAPGPIDWDKNNLRFVPSGRYNEYKFSCVMVNSTKGNRITVAKNDAFRTVTMVVETPIYGTLTQFSGTGGTSNFVDRAMLYSLRHKIDIAGPTATYADTVLSGGIVGWVDNGTEFIVQGGTSLEGLLPSFSEEVTLNEGGVYNSIEAFGATYSYLFQDIYDVTPVGFKCRRISSSTFDVSPLLPNGNRSLYPDIYYGMWAGVYWLREDYAESLRDGLRYLSGGYDAYTSMLESISFAEIAQRVNGGDPRVRYVSVSETGAVEFDTFCVELLRPDPLMKASYLQATEIKDRPVDLQNSTRAIGFELTPLPRTSISEIVRYRGNYAPKVRDVVHFVDDPDLEYLNTRLYTEAPATGHPFFVSRNHYFNKVNVENPNLILRSTPSDSDRGVFPDIGEIAIDRADLYLFRASWDPGFYRKYVKKDKWQMSIGTREPAEVQAYFASKCISLRDQVHMQTFPSGAVERSDIRTPSQIEVIPQSIVLDRSDRSIKLDVYVNYLLEDWLMADGFAAEFRKYVDPSLSFGVDGTDDDAVAYVRENVVDRYYVKDVRLFRKDLQSGEAVPEVVTTLDDAQKQRAGYLPTKDFVVRPSPDGTFFQLIHNPPADRRTSIAFSVVLAKK